MNTSRSTHLIRLGFVFAFIAIVTVVWVGVVSKANIDEPKPSGMDMQVAAQAAYDGSLTDETFVSPASPSAATYYVRPDGGSAEQCTGMVDAPFMPGSGSGEPCAWNHPFQALPPGGPPRIAGGDTLIIEAGEYEMGFGAPGAKGCDPVGSWDCYMSPIPSGPDPVHPTRILGTGWNNGCKNAPQLWGSERANYIVNLTGSSNIEVACLEITDHSSCIEFHLNEAVSPYKCERDISPYGDWAASGLYAEDSANVHLKDLNIHGLANNGILAGRLTDWTVENVDVVGNGGAGWNGDIDGEDACIGTQTFRHWLVAWNGCGETYPDGQHIGCWGQEAGGYGDGVAINTTGGHWVIEDAAILNNTQDGLDMLYVRLPGSFIEIRRVISAGNAGNQIKMTADQAIIENTIIVSNCGHFHSMPYWKNDDDCRANGDALGLFMQPGSQFTVTNSTITGEGGQLMVAACALEQTCDGSEQILVRNTLFQGQKIFYSPTDDVVFAWYDDEPPDDLLPVNPFVVDHSLITTGVRFGNVEPCPGNDNLCDVSSGVANAAVDSFDAHLLADSPAIDAGTSEGAPSVDFSNHPRDTNPDIGAYEWGLQIFRYVFLPYIQR